MAIVLAAPAAGPAIVAVGDAVAAFAIAVGIVGGAAVVADQVSKADQRAKEGLKDASIAPPCQDCDPCRRQNAEIIRVRNELKRRYDEMRIDKMKLFVIKRLGPMSWQGHINQFRSKQAYLRNLLLSLPPNCPPPPDAWEWATKDPPRRPAPRLD